MEEFFKKDNRIKDEMSSLIGGIIALQVAEMIDLIEEKKKDLKGKGKENSMEALNKIKEKAQKLKEKVYQTFEL